MLFRFSLFEEFLSSAYVVMFSTVVIRRLYIEPYRYAEKNDFHRCWML